MRVVHDHDAYTLFIDITSKHISNFTDSDNDIIHHKESSELNTFSSAVEKRFAEMGFPRTVFTPDYFTKCLTQILEHEVFVKGSAFYVGELVGTDICKNGINSNDLRDILLLRGITVYL